MSGKRAAVPSALRILPTKPVVFLFRGSYCALASAKLLNILTPGLANGVAEFVVECQTYEGGIGGTPFVEAHGGYTFCGLAATVLLGKVDLLDTANLLVG